MDNKDILNDMKKYITEQVSKIIPLYSKIHDEMGTSYEYIIYSREDWDRTYLGFTLSNSEYINIPNFYDFYYNIYKKEFIKELNKRLKEMRK